MNVKDTNYEKIPQDSDFPDQESYYEDLSDSSHGLLRNIHKPFKLYTRTLYIALTLSLAIISILTTLLIHTHAELRRHATSPIGLSTRRTEPRVVYMPSNYTSHNETEANEAWSGILAGHGVVALSERYVEQHGLPESVELPDGSGDRMYVLEAYHAMHCVVTIRSHFVEMEMGGPGNWSMPHDMHCFDALRQYIMCNVDDTLLYTNGHRESGVGQVKKCYDWDKLRDWAEEHSADYFDVEPEKGVRHLRNYHAGDGLPWGGL